MTIIAGIRKNSFVVLAADSLMSFKPPLPAEMAEVIPSRCVKVVLHPTLPLAMTSMGPGLLDEVEPGAYRLASGWLEHLMHRYQLPEQLLTFGITTDVKDVLKPKHDEWCARRGYDPAVHPWVILVAMAPFDAPTLFSVRIAGSVWHEDLTAHVEGQPDGMTIDSVPEMGRLGAVADQADSDVHTVASAVDEGLRAAIRYEASKHGGHNVRIGEPVTVAVVDGSGARFWGAGSLPHSREARDG